MLEEYKGEFRGMYERMSKGEESLKVFNEMKRAGYFKEMCYKEAIHYFIKYLGERREIVKD